MAGVDCPGCGAKVPVTAQERRDKLVTCGKCGEDFDLPGSAAAEPEPTGEDSRDRPPSPLVAMSPHGDNFDIRSNLPFPTVPFGLSLLWTAGAVYGARYTVEFRVWAATAVFGVAALLGLVLLRACFAVVRRRVRIGLTPGAIDVEQRAVLGWRRRRLPLAEVEKVKVVADEVQTLSIVVGGRRGLGSPLPPRSGTKIPVFSTGSDVAFLTITSAGRAPLLVAKGMGHHQVTMDWLARRIEESRQP
jgi:hypothetical protein